MVLIGTKVNAPCAGVAAGVDYFHRNLSVFVWPLSGRYIGMVKLKCYCSYVACL